MTWSEKLLLQNHYFLPLIFHLCWFPTGERLCGVSTTVPRAGRTNSFIHSTGFSGLRRLPLSVSSGAYSICPLSIFVRATIAHSVLPGKMLSDARGTTPPLHLAAPRQPARGAGSGERAGLSAGSLPGTAECKRFYSTSWSLQLLFHIVVPAAYVAYGSRLGHC